MFDGIFVDRLTLETGYPPQDGRDLGSWSSATEGRRAVEGLVLWLAMHVGDGDALLKDQDTGADIWRRPIGSDGVAILSAAWWQQIERLMALPLAS